MFEKSTTYILCCGSPGQLYTFGERVYVVWCIDERVISGRCLCQSMCVHSKSDKLFIRIRPEVDGMRHRKVRPTISMLICSSPQVYCRFAIFKMLAFTALLYIYFPLFTVVKSSTANNSRTFPPLTGNSKNRVSHFSPSLTNSSRSRKTTAPGKGMLHYI